MTRRKRGNSVRDRVPSLNKSTKKDQGDGSVAVAEQEQKAADQKAPETPDEGPTRTPAKLADYLAAQLHEAQGNLMEAKADILRLRQQLLVKDQSILKLQEKIHNLELKEVEKLIDCMQDGKNRMGLEFPRRRLVVEGSQNQTIVDEKIKTRANWFVI